jgi:hypothetical protein
MDPRTWAGFALDAFKVFCGAVIVIATIFTVFLVGPAVETRYFPVVDKLIIDRMEWQGPSVTRIWATFRKLRECEYVGISWFSGTRDDFERVPVILHREKGDTSSPNRPVGYQHAGPWDIGVPIYDIPTKSFARLSHRCHGFWTTTTEFYP